MSTVSYTHLSPEMGEQRVKGYIRALARRGAQLIVFPTLYGIETERVQAVSYTHLDVYKRQILQTA